MTTVVFTAETIAWDTRMTRGSVIEQSPCLDKVMVVKGRVFGFAGEIGVKETVVKWALRGAKEKTKPHPDSSWTLIELLKDNTVRVHESNNAGSVIMALPVCIGSGSDFAYTALALGKSAVEAVETAMKFDVDTGGQVLSLNTNDVPRRGRKPKTVKVSKSRAPVSKIIRKKNKK